MTKSITVPHRWITVTEISKDLSACGIKCCHVIICCSRYHCQSKTAHIKMSETSPSWHFLEEKRSVYTFVCACDTTAIWASVSSCHGWVWCSWGDIPLHLPCHNPISLSCLHSLRFPLTRGMCPSRLIPILSPPFVSSPHWCAFLVISWTFAVWLLAVKICRPINKQMHDTQTKWRITCIWTEYFC